MKNQYIFKMGKEVALAFETLISLIRYMNFYTKKTQTKFTGVLSINVSMYIASFCLHCVLSNHTQGTITNKIYQEKSTT